MATWNSSLEIGVPLIDLQHQQLLDQMDLLVTALKDKQTKQKITSIVSFLDMYVANHFKFEEECMHIKQCPVGGQNKLAHEYFVQRLDILRQDLQRANTDAALEKLGQQVSKEILDWFVNHIQGIDVHLGSCA